jgi:hypothetical protein
MSKDKLNDLKVRIDSVFSSSERQNNENLWAELAEFMLNNQFSFNRRSNTASTTDISSVISSTPGTKKTRRVYDSTALQAVADLSSAFQGTLTNPATVWSELRFKKEVLNNNSEAVAWLEKANNMIHDSFNESNFDTEIAKSYQSLVALANTALFHETKDNENTGEAKGFRFTSLHLSQIAWEENKDGIVDTVYRRFTLTARQAIQKWGDKVPHDIAKLADSDPTQLFDFTHAIFPRDPKDVKLNELGLAVGEHRPIASIYFANSDDGILEESGYYEMPVYVPRWSLLPGEQIGRGPSHLALPDTRTLNQLRKRGLEIIDLQVRPPMLANQRDVFGQLDLRPGQISIVKDHNGVREFVSQARNDVMQFSAEELREAIKGIFFLDKIQPLATLNKKERMSQFEVTKRLEEMQSVLGPVLSRLNSELLQPLIVRSFKILLRSGQLPEMPASLKEVGVDVDIVFVNQLARAQRVSDVSNIQQWVQNLGMLAQLDPTVIDNIDSDGIARHTAKILGVPEVAVANIEDVEAQRQARQQQAQQQQALESAQQVADISASVPSEEQ